MAMRTIRARGRALRRLAPGKRGPAAPSPPSADLAPGADLAPSDDALDEAALFRLMTWLSPAYPVGAFSYSSGIEWAVEAGDITDAASFLAWLAAMVTEGSGWSDSVFFSAAHRALTAADDGALIETAELAAALASNRERYLETTTLGGAFIEVTRVAWPCEALNRLQAAWRGPVAYPVAVGAACAGHGIPLRPALNAFATALVSNWISAGLRLIPLGHTDGQRLLNALAPIVAAVARQAAGARLEDVGSTAFRADIAGAKHETQYTRLFRS
jgi:urease accessory protein